MLFVTTKGHFGRKTDWITTLNNINRQFPLKQFAGKIASLKISPGEEAIGKDIEDQLISFGFKVLIKTASWSRGTNHQVAYNEDIYRLSIDPLINKQPYVWWLEDDGILDMHGRSLESLLSDSIDMLSEDADLLTVRVRRRGDDRGPEACPATNPHFFYSTDFNFQPAVLRSRDFQLAALFIARNPHLTSQVQIEALWRIILNNFTRKPSCHAVWECDWAEVYHIGVPQSDYEQTLNKLGITL